MRRILLILMLAVAAAGAWFVLAPGPLFGPRPALVIVSGSENEALEPIVRDWAEEAGVDVEMRYLGSVDISRELAKGREAPFDAVWPAQGLWIALGDTQRVVRHATSILRSPVVLALRTSIARDLGWIGRSDVTVAMIREAAAAGRFRLAMTSATQSNSGASAYLGFLYALAGNPDVLTLDHLADETVLSGVRDLLAQVDRSSGSSGWLKTALVENPGAFDGMINYEALAIEANRALVAAGQEPLHVIYPADGLVVADSPLGYVDKGDPRREEAFLALQKHLLGPEVQDLLLAQGRRTGLLGLETARADRAVWNPDWGIDLTRAIAPLPVPDQAVIAEALRLYQTDLRKPSLTVWVLDVSGSMQGEPVAALKQAMTLLLDPEASAVHLLQPSRRDVTIVIPFNHRVAEVWTLAGADPAGLARLLAQVRTLEAGGGTDLYGALIAALDQLAQRERDGTLFDYLPAIVAMTDGHSDEGNKRAFLDRLRRAGFGRDVPIHSIAFGDANEAQLGELGAATIGRLFRAGDDLAGALRAARGYN